MYLAVSHASHPTRVEFPCSPILGVLFPKQYKFVPSASWEGRLTIGLVSHCQCVTDTYHLWAQDLRKGDEHPDYAPVEYGTFYFFTLAVLCLHPLTQNNQFCHSNTYGEGRMFRSSAMPLHLHKCDTWFVSDRL